MMGSRQENQRENLEVSSGRFMHHQAFRPREEVKFGMNRVRETGSLRGEKIQFNSFF